VCCSLGVILVWEDRLVLQWLFALNPKLPVVVGALSDPELVIEEMGLLSVCQQKISHLRSV
jgi:hypothetical protein